MFGEFRLVHDISVKVRFVMLLYGYIMLFNVSSGWVWLGQVWTGGVRL